MISRRDKFLVRPWQQQRFDNHRRKVKSARPAIDNKCPTEYPHVTTKWKKIQAETERLQRINKENCRLLQRLGDIMSSKRLENFWQQPRPNFLNREKIEWNRPKTCKGRIESTAILDVSPINSSKEILTPSTLYSSRISTNRTKGSQRCPTCSGRPFKRNQVIPEPRTPWELPKKSWNRKIHTDELETSKVCSKCGCF
ncbi:uncharacterized protein LOC129609844 [Condylostylus longicornis]|uniref:uncharacterized protein LOC129609844 n=1 Tax=Condylostylus longicornis TaxID=2530218 RepID=UPI00244E2EBF|nr:uncharacterized protein LOC129609844 [Condylostylus longicornis]